MQSDETDTFLLYHLVMVFTVELPNGGNTLVYRRMNYSVPKSTGLTSDALHHAYAEAVVNLEKEGLSDDTKAIPYLLSATILTN